MNLIEQSRQCTRCTEWLDICKAECCSMISFDMSAKFLSTFKRFVTIKKICTPDQVWYYRMRSVKYAHGTLFFPKEKFIAISGRCVYVRKCEMLNDNYRCKGHPDKKPELCKALDLDLVKSGNTKGIFITPKCLFKYKAMDVN